MKNSFTRSAPVSADRANAEHDAARRVLLLTFKALLQATPDLAADEAESTIRVLRQMVELHRLSQGAV